MKWPLVLAAIAAASPAAAQDVAELYRQGVAARLAGEPQRAAELLVRVATAQPANSDAQVQLGLAYLALGRLDAAEQAFRRTLALAPDYADARIGLARVEQRRGHIDRALAELAGLDSANGEAEALRRQLAAAPKATGWRLDLDGSYSALTQSRDWQDASARLTRQADQRTAAGLGIEAARRFGRTDVYGEARIDHRFERGGSAYLFVGGTPGADFRPEWQVGAGLAAPLRGGDTATLATLDVRQARYRVGDIQTLSPGIEQYLAGGRAWVNVQWINLFDENGTRRGGWLARGNWQARDDLRLFAGAADAPDTAAGIVVDTFSLFGGLSYDVSPRTTLRLSLQHEDRAVGSDRLQLGIGAGLRF